MTALALLAFENLPKILEAIGILKKVPDAIETVKGLIAYVKGVAEHLKQTEPLTPEQEAQLDSYIDSLADEEFSQPEKS